MTVMYADIVSGVAVDRASSAVGERFEPSVVVGEEVHELPTARGSETISDILERERRIAASLAGRELGKDGMPGLSLLFPADAAFDDDEVDDDEVDTLVMSTRPGVGVGSLAAWRKPEPTGVTVEQFRARIARGTPAVDGSASLEARQPPERLDDHGVAVFDLVSIGADTWVRARR